MRWKIIALIIGAAYILVLREWADEDSFERLAAWTAAAVIFIWFGNPGGCYRDKDGVLRTPMVTRSSEVSGLPFTNFGVAGLREIGWLILAICVFTTVASWIGKFLSPPPY